MDEKPINSYIFIILDQSDEATKTEEKLRGFGVEIKIFNSDAEFTSHLKGLTETTKSIILITSGFLGCRLQSCFKHAVDPKIDSMYIYCQNFQAHQRWSSSIEKVKAVCTALDELIDAIKRDHPMLEYTITLTPNVSVDVAAETIPSETSTTEPAQKTENTSDTASVTKNDSPSVDTTPIVPKSDKPVNSYEQNFETNFSFHIGHDREYHIFKILHNHYTHVPPQEEDKINLSKSLKSEYSQDPQVLTIAANILESYSSDKPIVWIQQNSCLSRFLAKALISANAWSFIKWGFLFRDLQRQFNQCRSTINEQLFCSQICSTQQADELKANQGKYATLLSFASATTDRNMATAVLDSNSQTNGNIGVLFIIRVNSQTTDLFRCAKWDLILPNCKKDPNKVVFMLGSFFRIDKVESINQRRVDVYLTSCAYEDEGPNRQLYDHYKQMYITNNNSCSQLQFWCLAFHLGVKLDIESFISASAAFIVSITMTTTEKNVEVYDAQALIASHNKQWNETIDACQKSIELRNKNQTPPSQSFALIYQLLCEALQAKEKFEESIEHLRQGMVVVKKISTDNYDDDWQMLPFCRMMAVAHGKQNRFKEAVAYLYRALAILVQDDVPNEEELCQIYDQLGRSQDQAQLAAGFFLKSLAILEQRSTSNPAKIGDCHIRLGELYRKMQDLHNAREHFKRSLDIFEEIEPPGSMKIMEIETSLEQCS